MKKQLLALLKTKTERKTTLVAKAESSEDVAELRNINTELDTLNTEIRSMQEIVDGMPDDLGPVLDQKGQSQRTLAVNSDVPAIVNSGLEKRKTKIDDSEYRVAFANLVTRNVEIPVELRSGTSTVTTDVGSVMPPQLVNKIVEKLESTGMILPLITKTSFASGINIPTSSVKPVATWVSEGAGSDRQKKTTGVITFTNFKLRCEISMSMEVSVETLAIFEANFVKQVAEAMVKAQEEAIINGDGLVSPKGILKETPVAGQALETSTLSYKDLIACEAAIPQAYEGNAVWCMTKKTFLGFIGMVDEQGQPISRTNYGIGGKPERTLLGRTVVSCGDYMESFSATVAAGTKIAFIFDFSDYVFNTVYDMGIQKRQDWDTEDMQTKAVMACDGKVVDKNSLVTLSKKE